MSSSRNTASRETSRLPPYRASHLGRFHPYPRTHLSVHEGLNLASNDRSNPPLQRRSSFALPAMIMEDCELELEIIGSSSASITNGKACRRQKLKILAGHFADLVAAFCRKYRIVRSDRMSEEKIKCDVLN